MVLAKAFTATGKLGNAIAFSSCASAGKLRT
jgi:hypothetical protein